jgi:hypothetical protein
MMVFSAQLIEGGSAYPCTLFHSIYILHPPFELRRPLHPLPARLARYSYLFSFISPLFPSLWVQRPKQKLIVREGNPNYQCLCALQRKSHLCITFLGIARPQSQFPHSCVCERFISNSWFLLNQRRRT